MTLEEIQSALLEGDLTEDEEDALRDAAFDLGAANVEDDGDDSPRSPEASARMYAMLERMACEPVEYGRRSTN